MKRMKRFLRGVRVISFVAVTVFLTVFLSVRVCAEAGSGETGGESFPDEGMTLPDSYQNMEDAIPKEVRDLLPDGLFSGDAHEVSGAAEKLSDPGYLFSLLAALSGTGIRAAVSLFCVLCGILILSAAAGSIREGLGGGGGDTFAFAVRVTVFAAIGSTLSGTVETVQTYFSHLTEFCTSLVPLLGTLYAIGGNVRGAVASTAVLELYLSAIGSFAGSTVIPLFCACLVLLLIGAFGSVDTSAFSGFLRKTYTTVLAFFLLLLGLLLAGRSVLAAKNDSVGLRGVRFAVGNFVPVVGGTVADMTGTVAAGVEYLRGTVGVTLLFLLAVLLLPTVLGLFLTRASFSLASGVAGLLGCREEKGLLSGISELYGYLIGIACLCASVAVVALAILVTTAAAIGT